MAKDDDDAIDLPPLPGVGADEEVDLGAFGALSIDPSLEESAGSIGLDDSAGLEGIEAADFLSVTDAPSAIGDDAEGLDALRAPAALLSLAKGETEYGYRDGNEPLEDLHLGAMVDELEDLAMDDGLEGLEDPADFAFSGEDSPDLPPLLRPTGRSNIEADDDTIDDLDVGLSLFAGDSDDAMAGSASQSDFEAARRDVAPLALGSSHVRWELSESVFAVSATEGRVYAAGERIYRFASGRHERAAAAGLQGEVVSMAASGDELLVGTRLRGVFRSTDGGETFAPTSVSSRSPTVAAYVLRDAGGRWWLRVGGSLYRSKDGERWLGPLLPAPVGSLCPYREGIAALAASDDGATLFLSEDGVRWARRSLSTSGASGRLRMLGERAVVLDASRAGAFVEGDAMPWTAGASFLVDGNDGQLLAVRYESAGDRFVVVEHRAGGARVIADEGSKLAAVPDGNHHVYDATWDGARLWLALGGGVCSVEPKHFSGDGGEPGVGGEKGEP